MSGMNAVFDDPLVHLVIQTECDAANAFWEEKISIPLSTPNSTE